MMRRGTTLLLAGLLLATLPLGFAADEIPARPEQIEYKELKFEVPDPASFRHTLSNGIVVYVGENQELPLVDLSVMVRTGSYLDPADKPGVASLTGAMIRRGGAGEQGPDEFDEAADFLAAQLSSFVGDTQAGASMNCTSQTLDDCLTLFFEMIRTPRFDEDRLALEKTNILEQMKQRNDDARSIASREWGWLMHGENHFSSRSLTQAQLEAIGRDDLVAFHEKYFRPDNMMITVSGNVDTAKILEKLEQKFAGWTDRGEKVPWPPAAPAGSAAPGVYYVDKDIPQGRVRIGYKTFADPDWSNPDRYAVALMNEVLGGGGFTSRLTKRIRSDEGLAYSAGSSYSIGSYMPGTFSIYYQSKSETVALAAKIAAEEIRKIQQEPISEEELAVAKAAFIDTFPSYFESTDAVISLYAQDEYIGRSHDFWKSYRENYDKVTIKDIQKAAKKYLDAQKLVFLVVGDKAAIEVGDANDRADMTLFHEGKSTTLPLRDPLTLEEQAE